MAATLQHNITTVLTQTLLSAGDRVQVNNITLANVDSSNDAKVDLFLNKEDNNYYILKEVLIPIGSTLVLNKNDNISFNNNSNGFSLRIQVDDGSTTAVAVDVIIT
jgi:hypothetical protein|tara:strand:+ start:577 stop:894 length:318 start_codon:yes stop_codon:yes gene_type:complete